MAEYIEREALNCMLSELEELARKRVYDTPTSSPAYMRYVTQSQERTNLKDKMSELPAADVAPVVHGRWVKDNAGVICCSQCGEEHEWEDYRASYCDTCGAKMQEGR